MLFFLSNSSGLNDRLRCFISLGKIPSQIVDEEGLSQISDSSEIEEIVDEVISANQESAQDYINGKKKALGFLVGQVMKATKGKANPKLVNQILTQKLTGE